MIDVKRIEKIYHQLMHNFHDSSLDHLLKVQGNSAKEIAEQLKMERSNVSFELNNLVRSKKVIKIKTFPVRYLPVEIAERLCNKKWDTEMMEVKGLEPFSGNPEQNHQHISTNPLELMIGAKGSLKKAISQAKAAVFYPPNGLHMLLLGPTGSGKSPFCEPDLPVCHLL